MSPEAGTLAGMVAMVTGSIRGIGRATLLALAAAGADVIVHSRKASERGLAVQAHAEAFGVRAHQLYADIAQEEAVRELVEEAWAWQGHVDLWVNNAGADILSGGRYQQDWESKLQLLLHVDVQGTVTCSELVAARMLAQGGGHIINLGWDQAEVGGTSTASGRLFSLAKGGIMSYSRALARAVAPSVRVNCVAPGWIETAWGQEVSLARKERIRQTIPLQRWGTPHDVAEAVVWLASPAAVYITGQTIRINGGAAVS